MFPQADLSVTMLLLSILAGYILGVISGLIPGIHTNNFAMVLVYLSSVMADYGITTIYAAVIISSNSITHTFHDVIPSIFLGAPSEDMALAVLPGHQLSLEGSGAEAIKLSAIGSAGSIIFSLILVLPVAGVFSTMYPIIQNYMGWILLVIILLMVATEKGESVAGQGQLVPYKHKFYAFVIFLLSGLLGYFAFETEYLIEPVVDIGSPSILLPLLSGLFGASQLVISLMSRTDIPPQKYSIPKLERSKISRGIAMGSVAGSIVAWIPGISSSIATVISRLFITDNFNNKNTEDELDSSKEFIVSVSGVNTSNAVFGLLSLVVIEKTRSGAMVAFNKLIDASQLNGQFVILFFCIILAAAFLSYLSTIVIGNNAYRILSKIDYYKLCISVILGLALLVFLFTGLYGLLIFIIATPIGMMAPFMTVKKSNAMGVILLPIMLYFL
ncbi:protein of unknown function DUF112 transmembrane [Methanohalobium evestigatum Z-7303]|uniref:DUF112 domain-containing protein n=1 Tax=Methanohalobium evestigatum (strain ATCC BAA-1072 / DSM 3721 / NBRC 107634 / OCM 161 / Z-7303) TaxID=644295 RepID=D7E6W2_METEZ|nr:tripartite tricarboxylate transporter permease [Methanohalobium evestigatum]ADI73586.1 protein of unknown function DUF112 transmembrane [Methanohalobium evestigatum Z-7303]